MSLYPQCIVNVTGRPVSSRSRQVAVTVLLMPDTVDTVTWAPDDGWRYYSKHVEQFTDINKLYIVAYYWTFIDIYFTMHGPLNVKFPYKIWKGSHLMKFTAGQCILSDFMWYLSVTETQPPFVNAFEKMLCKERYIVCVIYAVITKLGTCSTQLRA